jgi:hypothetical protein
VLPGQGHQTFEGLSTEKILERLLEWESCRHFVLNEHDRTSPAAGLEAARSEPRTWRPGYFLKLSLHKKSPISRKAQFSIKSQAFSQKKAAIKVKLFTGYAYIIFFLWVKIIWDARWCLCLNRQSQCGQERLGSWPHSSLMWRSSDFFQRYLLKHWGQSKSPTCNVVDLSKSS